MGMEILREKTDKFEEEARHKAVGLAMGTLSYSEMEAVEQVFEEITGDESLLIASKIADELGITCSVIVNALRKLESAGVLESRSLGMLTSRCSTLTFLNTWIISVHGEQTKLAICKEG